MKENAKILVGVDLGEMDSHLFSFINEFLKKFTVQKFYFVHVIPENEFPENVDELFPELDEPLEELVRKDIKASLEENCPDTSKMDTEVAVLRGQRDELLVDFAEDHQIDLIMLGVKQSIGGTGISIDRVAAFANCSTLFIPENANTEFNKILTLVNFDKLSRITLNNAIGISEKYNGQVYALHIYGLPFTYFPGSPVENLKIRMNKQCKNEFDKMLEKVKRKDVNIDCEILLDDKNDRGSIISDHIRKIKADLLVIGLKEESDNSAFLIHRLTEKFRAKNLDLPLWVVKEKKSGMGIF